MPLLVWNWCKSIKRCVYVYIGGYAGKVQSCVCFVQFTTKLCLWKETRILDAALRCYLCFGYSKSVRCVNALNLEHWNGIMHAFYCVTHKFLANTFHLRCMNVFRSFSRSSTFLFRQCCASGPVFAFSFCLTLIAMAMPRYYRSDYNNVIFVCTTESEQQQTMLANKLLQTFDSKCFVIYHSNVSKIFVDLWMRRLDVITIQGIIYSY